MKKIIEIFSYSLLLLSLTIVTFTIVKRTLTKKTAYQVELSETDKRTIDYESTVKEIEQKKSCKQLIVDEEKSVPAKIKYLHCPAKTFEQEGKPFHLTADFEVTPGVVRKYHFWRRVYGLWGKNDYPIHSSKYPEVILAVVSHDDEDAHLTGKSQRKLRKLVTKQKRLYRNLLYKLHKQRKRPLNKLDPALLRIARLMEHIKDKNKYLLAAQSLRSQRGQRHFVKDGIVRSGRYLPYIEYEFSEKGLPIELAYIGFVESSFNPKAVSKVGASGVYQIMPATAGHYLIRRYGIDERNDPIKAGRLAAIIFATNYSMVQSWPLAVTGYNHGINSIKRAIRQTKSNDYDVILKNYKTRSFGFASKNFYSEFLAMVYTIKNARTIFPNILPEFPLRFKEQKLTKPTRIKNIMKQYEMTSREFHDMNLDVTLRFIRNNGTLPKGFKVKVPVLNLAKKSKKKRRNPYQMLTNGER